MGITKWGLWLLFTVSSILSKEGLGFLEGATSLCFLLHHLLYSELVDEGMGAEHVLEQRRLLDGHFQYQGLA